MSDGDESCPVCKTKLTAISDGRIGDYIRFDCPRCGEFDVSGSVSISAFLRPALDKKPYRRALMSHKLRRTKARPTITSYDASTYWQEDKLPSPIEQESSLLLFIGDNQPSQGQPLRVSTSYLCAWIGTDLSVTDLWWLLRHLASTNIIKWDNARDEDGILYISLNMPGWQKYADLKRQDVESRVALMAMKFGDSELNDVVRSCFKPAVEKAGFELRTIDEHQKAGSIDNQLRAALISARFVVADLSHANQGAYWEAGFAEGLGRPVFYTCKSAVWEKEKTHFDTNHMTTIIWDTADLPKAAKALTATIRATLRTEAKQND